MELPDWLDKEGWEDYKAMRKLIKKPMTPRAEELAIKKLKRLINQGYNNTDILEQSVFNSWQGLFPIKEEFNGIGIGNSKPNIADEALYAKYPHLRPH